MSKAEIKIQMPEFTKQMLRLKKIYTNTWFLPDTEAIEVWFDALCNYSERQIKMAIDNWFKTGRDEPKPCDLVNIIEASGMDQHGGVKGDPTEWPAVVVLRAKDHAVMYSCFISPTKEITGAKNNALGYVLQTARHTIKVDDQLKVVPYTENDLIVKYVKNEDYKKGAY